MQRAVNIFVSVLSYGMHLLQSECDFSAKRSQSHDLCPGSGLSVN